MKKIKPTTLADIGCGDCSDTIYYSDYVENIFAFDYSETMLRKAAKIVNNKRIKLSKFDILKETININVDIITTKRCLINLGTFENQKDAIRKIHDSLNKDGYYLMLECSLNGLNNLNILRQKVGLNPISEPFHNLYFELNDLMTFVQDFFDIETIENFSTYYFLTRIYNQILDSTKYSRFDNFARRIHNCIDIFGSNIIDPQFLIVCRKKISTEV